MSNTQTTQFKGANTMARPIEFKGKLHKFPNGVIRITIPKAIFVNSDFKEGEFATIVINKIKVEV